MLYQWRITTEMKFLGFKIALYNEVARILVPVPKLQELKSWQELMRLTIIALKPCQLFSHYAYGSETCGFWPQVLVTVFGCSKRYEIVGPQAMLAIRSFMDLGLTFLVFRSCSSYRICKLQKSLRLLILYPMRTNKSLENMFLQHHVMQPAV